MSTIKTKKQKTLERREKINSMLLIKTEDEIKDALHISRSTVAREKKVIREDAKKWLDDLIGGDAQIYFSKLICSIWKRISMLNELLTKTQDKEEQRDIMADLREEEIHFYRIFKDGPLFDSLKRIEAKKDD